MADASGIFFGTELEFESANGGFIDIHSIDESTFMMSYRTGSGILPGHARIGTVSGTTISVNQIYPFDEDSDVRGSSSLFSADKAIFTFRAGGSGGIGLSRIGSISGTTISYGPYADFNDGGTISISTQTILTDYKFVVVYRDSSDGGKGHARVGTVSGLTITYGNEFEYNVGNSNFKDIITTLDNNRIIIFYRDPSDSYYGKSVVGTVSGTTITFDSPVAFNPTSSVSDLSSYYVSTDKVIISYHSGGDSYTYCKIASISGTDITFGSGVSPVPSTILLTPTITRVDVDRFVCSYADSSDSSHGTSKIGTISGNVITFEPNDGDEFFSDGLCDSISSNTLSPTKLLIVYRDKVVGSTGEIVLGSIPSVTYDMTGSGNLFTKGHLNSSISGNLYTYGRMIDSGHTRLYIRGIIMAPAQTLDQTKSIDWLLRTPDYNPQIIGTFETLANIVTMQVFDSDTILISLSDSNCYAIGDTGRWGWSTANLPSIRGNPRFYSYVMTSDAGETFGGQFILDVPEKAKWIHPDNFEDFIV